jgi:hypothetical protein
VAVLGTVRSLDGPSRAEVLRKPQGLRRMLARSMAGVTALADVVGR